MCTIEVKVMCPLKSLTFGWWHVSLLSDFVSPFCSYNACICCLVIVSLSPFMQLP